MISSENVLDPVDAYNASLDDESLSFDGWLVKYSEDYKQLLTTVGDIKSYSIKEGTVKICDGAFYDCKSLISIHIPESVTEIGESAFKGCSKLTFLKIPVGVKIIGNKAFEGCEKLEDIEFSDTVESIGDKAFGCCYSIKKLYIPESVKYMGGDVFAGCSSLKSITFEGVVEKIGSIKGWVEDGGYNDFEDDYVYESDLDKAHDVDEDEMYIDCVKYWRKWHKLKILVPYGKENEYAGTFGWLKELKNEMQLSCLTEVTDMDLNSCAKDEKGVLYSKDWKRLLKATNLQESNYSIKDGTSVVCDNAFTDNDFLVKVRIPSSISHIGIDSFSSCSQLKEVVFEGKPPVMIGNPFPWCNSLKHIFIPFGLNERYAKCLTFHSEHIKEEQTITLLPIEVEETIKEKLEIFNPSISFEGIDDRFKDAVQCNEKRIINQTCITAVIENNGLLERKDFPISNYDSLFGEMKGIVDNPNKTILDLQDFYFRNVNIKRKEYDYCLPYDYDSFFIQSIREPNEISISEYDDNLKAEKLQIRQELEEQDTCHNNIIIDNIIKEKLAAYNYKLKDELFADYKNFVRAYLLCLMTQKIKHKSKVKMWSAENRGWTKFHYQISKDVNVLVNTNFSFGKSSYFDVIVKFKDIIIIPYSYVVKYRYANYMEIRKCTRAYRAKRENWDLAFDFVVNFVNKSIENPKEFVISTIMNEINELITGLDLIMQAPKRELEKMCRISDNDIVYKSIRVVQFPENHYTLKEIQNIFPSEFLTIFKAEKICGSLLFIDSLKRVSEICPDIVSVINKIEQLNKDLFPEIQKVIIKAGERLIGIKEKICKLKKVKADIDTKIQPYQSELDSLLGVISKNQTEYAIRLKYKEDHPEYANLLTSRIEIEKVLRKKQIESSNCRRMKDYLAEYESQINSYFMV